MDTLPHKCCAGNLVLKHSSISPTVSSTLSACWLPFGFTNTALVCLRQGMSTAKIRGPSLALLSQTCPAPRHTLFSTFFWVWQPWCQLVFSPYLGNEISYFTEEARRRYSLHHARHRKRHRERKTWWWPIRAQKPLNTPAFPACLLSP